MAEQERTTKPTGGPAGPGAKGAHVEGQMGPPHSPTGPNETDGDPSGVLPPTPIEPPGEDQVGLVGGDVGAPQTSQTGNPNWKDTPPDEAEAKRHARPENKAEHKAESRK